MDFFRNIEFDLGAVGLRILLAVITVIVGRSLAHMTRRGLLKTLQKTDLTESLNTLIITLSYYTIVILSVLLALVILGVPVTVVVTSVGLILVVLAIALQQSLGDLAATVNFLLFKPFEVGDIIETGAVQGTVHAIQMFSTVIVSPDHKTHVLPNSKIQSAGLANYSKIGTIRLDLSFGISYDSDVDKAEEILAQLLAEDERVLAEPPPRIFVQGLADSQVEIAARPFVQIADFLTFRNDITGNVKKAFDEAGIVIPYPQRDVHLINQNE